MPTFSLRTKRTIRGATTAVLASVIALVFHLDDPFWALFAVYAVMSETSTHHALKKGILRVVGTITGAIAGVMMVMLLANNVLGFWLVVFLLAYLSMYFSHLSRYPYAWILFCATAFLVMMTLPFSPDEVFTNALWRVIETCLGIITVWLVGLLVFPEDKPEAVKKNVVIDANYKHDLAKFCVRHGIACVITFFLIVQLNWYGGSVGAISVLVVASFLDKKAATLRAKLRFWGCLCGGVLGIAALHWTYGNLYLLVIYLVIGNIIFSYFAAGPGTISYGGIQGGYAFAMGLLPTTGGLLSTDISQPLQRLAGIFIGIIVALVLNHLLWPHLFAKPNPPPEPSAKQPAK